MSLILDLNKYAKKTFNKLITFCSLVVVLACVLMTVLPDLLSSRASGKPDVLFTGSSRSNIETQIKRQLEATKLRLIFRTHTDLADKLGIPQQDISLNETIPKVWADTSLECPAPVYGGDPLTQVPQRINTQGWLITFKLGNTMYEYNTSVKGDWILCSKNEIPEDIAQYRSPANDYP